LNGDYVSRALASKKRRRPRGARALMRRKSVFNLVPSPNAK